MLSKDLIEEFSLILSFFFFFLELCIYMWNLQNA